MCDFISWIEKDGRLWYLTSADLSSKRGKEYREDNPRPDDFPGHGAIRWFYGLSGGTDHEQTDFSSPDNFPPELAAAIKAGKFCRWFGGIPQGLLIAPLDANYREKRDALDADYREKIAPLDADYREKIDALHANYREQIAPLYADFRAKIAPLYADFRAKIAPLDADYREKIAPLDADYREKIDALDLQTWHLFLTKENRAEAWK